MLEHWINKFNKQKNLCKGNKLTSSITKIIGEKLLYVKRKTEPGNLSGSLSR